MSTVCTAAIWSAAASPADLPDRTISADAAAGCDAVRGAGRADSAVWLCCLTELPAVLTRLALV